MDNHTDRIISYLENHLSEDECVEFEKLMQDDPELKEMVKDFRFIREASADLSKQKQIDVQQNWDKISRRITWDTYKQQIWHWTQRAAAVLLIPLLIGTATFYYTYQQWMHQSVELVEQTSAYGLVSKVTLSDGSEIWLNSGSRLSYPKHFTNGVRQVYLSGEAYFKVSSDKSNRFDVIAPGGLTVSAYGTEFNVNAYEEDSKIETSLAKGAVELSEGGLRIPQILQPGEQAVFDKSSKNLEIASVNLMPRIAWKDGRMVFRRATMNEIAKRLSRHFNVDIRLEGNELQDYEYSATFTTESLDDILRLLEKSAPIKCTIIEPEQNSDYAYSKRIIIICTLK